MGDFFHGWRRKTGCIALVISLAFTCGWMRSLVVADRMYLSSFTGSTFEDHAIAAFGTDRHSLAAFAYETKEFRVVSVVSPSFDASKTEESGNADARDTPPVAPQASSKTITYTARTLVPILSIPFWLIVLPLILLAAYLLLCKPRDVAHDPSSGEGTCLKGV